jgi:hypothetical protein
MGWVKRICGYLNLFSKNWKLPENDVINVEPGMGYEPDAIFVH